MKRILLVTLLALAGCEQQPQYLPDSQPQVEAVVIFRHSPAWETEHFSILRLTINGTNYLCHSRGGITKE